MATYTTQAVQGYQLPSLVEINFFMTPLFGEIGVPSGMNCREGAMHNEQGSLPPAFRCRPAFVACNWYGAR